MEKQLIIFGNQPEIANRYLSEEDSVFFYHRDASHMTLHTGIHPGCSEVKVTDVDLVEFLIKTIEKSSSYRIVNHVHEYMREQSVFQASDIPRNIIHVLQDAVSYRAYLFDSLEKLESFVRDARFRLNNIEPFSLHDSISIEHVARKSIESRLNLFYAEIRDWWNKLV